MSKIDDLRNRKIRRLVAAHVPKGGSVLELSCGNGEALLSLLQDGYEVRGTNFTAYPNAPQNLPIDNGVDVLTGLAYADGSFDCVMLLDVIEHLSDQARVIREVARVVKPGGCVIVVTPNMMSLSSRLQFLCTGFFKTKRSFIGFDVPPEKAFAFHNHPVHLPLFLYQLRAQGLEDADLQAVGYKAKTIIFWLLLGWILLPLTYYKTHRLEKFLAGTPAAGVIFRRVVSFVALCSESWMLLAIKRQAARPAEGATPMPAWYHGDTPR